MPLQIFRSRRVEKQSVIVTMPLPDGNTVENINAINDIVDAWQKSIKNERFLFWLGTTIQTGSWPSKMAIVGLVDAPLDESQTSEILDLLKDLCDKVIDELKIEVGRRNENSVKISIGDIETQFVPR
jgi:hypothetical protein